MKLPYNPNDKNSILEFAKLLKGKTLREACDKSILKHNYSGKGNFGQILEKFYFLYEPNSDSEPDFAIAGLELKSTPLKQLQNKEYRSKERLVLNIINYIEVVNQDFETSSFWKKNANILLIFYLHQAGYDILDYLIKLVDEWNFPKTDLEIIKKDWQLIKQKIADGKAHELSEGDTFYLGACTKGANANSTRKQPFNDIPAKQRAYSLKQGYVNHIIASIANEATGIYGKLIPSVAVAKKQTI
jgi:DNA mismatch repair protein MutH